MTAALPRRAPGAVGVDDAVVAPYGARTHRRDPRMPR